MKRNIYLLSIILIITSCNATQNYLPKEIYKYSPYKGRERLIFTSSDNANDTLQLAGRHKEFSPAHATSDNKVEELYIDFKDKDNENNTYNARFITWSMSEEGFIFLNVDFSLSLADFYGDRISMRKLSTLKPVSISINNVTYPDVIMFPEDQAAIRGMDLEHSPKRVTKVFWSKSAGLLKYETLDGSVWQYVQQ